MKSLFASALLSVFLLSPTASAESASLKVGFIGDFSGAGKAYGEACKNGFELALKDATSPGLSVIYEDDQFIAAKTVTAFRKLVSIDNVDVVITLGSTPSHAVAPLAQSMGVPLIAWASDVSVAKGRDMVLRSWVSGEDEGARIASEAKAREYKNIGFLTITGDYSRSVQKGFIAGTPLARLTLSEEYPADSQDFKPFLMRAKALDIDGLGMCVNPGQPRIIAKQAAGLGFRPTFFGCEFLHDREEVSSAGDAFWGSWLVTGGVSESFHDRYQKTFGNDNVISGAAIHYDIAVLLSELTAKQVKKEALLETLLAEEERTGAIGKFTPVARDGDQFLDIRLVVKEITAEGFREVSE